MSQYKDPALQPSRFAPHPDSIIVPERRLRTYDPAWAETLAKSFQEIGQTQAIVVRSLGENGGTFELVDGEHRLGAARFLGWDKIACDVVHLSEDEARLIEVDSLICRRDSTPFERDLAFFERKAIYERLYPETKHGGDHESVRRTKASRQNGDLVRFTKDAARKTGFGERTIQRSVSRVERLHPDVREALKVSPLGRNASEIEALSKLPQEDQTKIAGAIVRGAKTLLNARKAVGLAPDPKDPVELAFNKIDAAWARAPKASREKFLDQILPTWRKLKIAINEPEPKVSAADAPASDDDAGDAE